MTKESTQILLDAIQSLRTEVARIDRDLGKDRDALDGMKLEFSTLKERVDQFSKQLDTQQTKIQDKMADVVEPLMGQIDQREVIEYKSKPFWKFWKKGGK